MQKWIRLGMALGAVAFFAQSQNSYAQSYGRCSVRLEGGGWYNIYGGPYKIDYTQSFDDAIARVGAANQNGYCQIVGGFVEIRDESNWYNIYINGVKAEGVYEDLGTAFSHVGLLKYAGLATAEVRGHCEIRSENGWYNVYSVRRNGFAQKIGHASYQHDYISAHQVILLYETNGYCR